MSDKTTAHTGLPGQELDEKEDKQFGGISPEKLNSIKEQVRKQIIERRMQEDGMTREEAEASADAAIEEIAKKAEEDRSSNAKEFDHDFLKVYMNDPFIGSVSSEVSKIADYNMPTAYVGVRPNGRCHEVIMGFNPNFFRSLSPAQRQGVIKHEMYHLIFQHIFERAPGDKDYQILWNWACFPEGTILAGGSRIENVGNSTYGQTGKVDIVTPMSRPYNGKMYNVRAGGMTTRATGEHPFRVVRRKNKRRPIALNAPEWVKAGDIKKGDYLVVPKLPETFVGYSLSLEDFIKKGSDSKGRNTFGNRVPSQNFILNNETAWLLGLYAAEGSGKDRVSLSLGTYETNIINRAMDVAQYFGYSPSTRTIHENNSTTEIRFGGPVLAKAFKSWCGDGAANKQVPEFILFHADKSIVKSFLEGLVDGDGWEYQKNNSTVTTIGHGTKSRLLASHVRLCLAKLDLGFNGSDRPQKDRFINEHFVAGGSEFYTTNWTWTPSLTKRVMNGKEITSYSHRWKKVDEGIAIPVTEIVSEDYQGRVYNIETSDHTYIVDGILVHNCDLAINSIIGEKNLPDACLIPGKNPIDPATGKEITGPYAAFIGKAPKLESSDFYFEKLREIEEQQKKQGNNNSVTVAVGKGMNSIDDHGKWGDLPPEVREQIRDKVRDMLEKAVKRADRTNDWGSVPHEIAEIIRKILSREIDWRAILRQFIGRCRSMERNSTIKRINKKAPYLFPGHKRKYKANFACFIDQSGSMSDDDIAMLFSELETFAGQTDLDVYHFDTQVDDRSHTVWKKGRPFPPAHRTRCGGTDFNCVRDFCNQPENRGKWSGIVMLTDGYAPTMGQIIGTRVIWVITEHGTMDAVRKGDLAVQMKKSKQFKRYFYPTLPSEITLEE